MWCDKCFCLDFRLWGVPSGSVLGLVGGASPPRVADSNAIAARLQGPFPGVGLDELSLDAAEATRRDACEKSGLQVDLASGGGARSSRRRRRASTCLGMRPIIMERICKRRPSTRSRRASSSATCYLYRWVSRSWPARRASSRRSSSSRTSSRRSSSTRSFAARPFPLPRPCKRCPLPRQRRLRNWARLRGWIVGEASSSELGPSSRRDTRKTRLKFTR